MADVFISHAVEDRPAAVRLADALRRLGLGISAFTRAGPQVADADAPEQGLHGAAAVIVIWSKHALTSETVLSDATLALQSDPPKNATAISRYAAIATGGVKTSDLPVPFDRVETADWESWFAGDTSRFDDPRFVSLLASVEAITGLTNLNKLALAIAAMDHDAERLRSEVASKDAALADAKTHAVGLQSRIEAHEKEIATARLDFAALSEKHAILDTAFSEQAHRLSVAESRLRDEQASAHAAQSSLEAASRALHEAQSARHALELDLEDAKNGLAASLRQQKTLQAQIHADDESIREIMSQREALIAAKDKMEKESAKLSIQLKDLAQRLTDSDQARRTYETALIDRNSDIRRLEDRLATSSAEIGALKPQAEELSRVVKSWGHVPWRRVAAGAAAAGVVMTSFVVLAERSIRWTSATTSESGPAQGQTPAAQTPLADVAARDAIPPKSAEKVEPDSLQLVERGAPDSFDFRDPDAADAGEIPIPDESGVPISNDQVQFNPEGLPPVDPYSRPPPQDLPPAPQKPRLLLKPQPPAAP